MAQLKTEMRLTFDTNFSLEQFNALSSALAKIGLQIRSERLDTTVLSAHLIASRAMRQDTLRRKFSAGWNLFLSDWMSKTYGAQWYLAAAVPDYPVFD